ncbi:MAG: long-chain-fatty-acid--CoA ligase [Actinobacteria bacterium]|uniref:Unannotated protein n=1 Tax=freshwater metagenome TaxID=449393 RepID=A0A6J7L9L2_9ZZZZ|nr:long-chain-fatty-acid--CoA ligase [Actinomycetota bacterium]
MTAVSMAQLTPLSFLERSATVWADKIAYVDGEQVATYSQMAAEAEELAQALLTAGIRKGDRVAYMMPNVPKLLVAHFGVPLAGATLVAINTRLAADEINYILRHSGARILIVDAVFADVAARAAVGLPNLERGIVAESSALPGSDLWMAYPDFIAVREECDVDWSVDSELDPITINYTSGTTGRPKGVVYSHRGAYLNALGELIHSRHSPQSVYLWTLPMFHCNGWCTAWAITAVGGTHVCLREVRADVIWDAISNRGVTHLNAAPTVITSILNHDRATELNRPVIITTAGASPSPTLINQAEVLGFEIVHVYGLTETYGPFSICEIQPNWIDEAEGERAALMARQGVPMVQAGALRVVDLELNDVPADGQTMGEIVMRGNNVMIAYFDDPDATEQAFRGGWFHSGDLGVMYPDGYIALRDRAKDVIISGGENISTVEVEQAIISHPAVLEVAVVGVPDEKWGERPKAFVIIKDGQSVTPAELIEHVRSRIAHYKAPRDVVIVDQLPKTSTGKIQKYALRDIEWAGRDRRIQ